MNPLLRWLTSPEWAHVVTALLHSLWLGAIVALALAVLMRRLTNPLTRYRCALSALGVIGIAGIVTWALLNAPNSVPQSTPATASEPTAPALTADAFDSNPTDKVVVIGQMTRPEAPTHWTAWLALTWMAGALVMLLRAGVKVAGAEKLRRSCQPLADEHIALLVTEACRAVGLARKIRVAVTDKLTSPAVVGVIVPTLILPLSLFTTLTPTQIQFVLLHELAHIRRGDYFANLFQLFAEALLFFNPAVWWISHQIRREREACCDALAIELSGAPADYARTLVRVAENILQPAPAAAPAFGDDGREPSSLADRVQRLLVPGYRPTLRLTWRAMLTSLLVGGTLLVLSAVGTRNTVGAILTSSQPTTSPTPPVLLGPGIGPDVQSAASGDDSTFQTTIIPALIEFVGYDLATAATFVPTAITGTGQTLAGTLPLPIFRVRQFSTSNYVEDGQTNKLDGLPSDHVTKIKEKVPVLADLPLLGKLFTSESSKLSSRVDTDAFGMNAWMVDGKTQSTDQPFYYRVSPTTEPLYSRVFQIDLNRFYTAVRKSTGLPETATGTNLSPAIRSFFTNAGVNLDPALGRGYFLSDSRGDLVVRATIPELDAIEALLQPMKGTPLMARTYLLAPDSLAKVGGTLPPEINSILATNPAAGLRALIESFDRNDPRPKHVRYLAEREEIYARATELDFERLESALKGILSIKPAPDLQRPPESFSSTNLSAQVTDVVAGHITANLTTGELIASNQVRAVINGQPTNAEVMRLKLPVTSSATNAPAPEPLYTREFDLPPDIFYAKILTNQPASFTNLINTGLDSQTAAANLKSIREQFRQLGVDLDPALGRSLYYSDRKGHLLVRATKADLDTVEAEIRKLFRRQQPQVHLKVQWVEMPTSAANELLTPTNTGTLQQANVILVLSAKRMEHILSRLKARDGIDLLSEGQVTTLSDRAAQLQVADLKTLVTGINPKALASPGIVSTNDDGAAALEFQAMPFGPVIDVLPRVNPNLMTVTLHAIPLFKEFLGYEKNPPEIPVYVNGKQRRVTQPLPRFRTRQMTNDVTLWDGQTLVLGHLTTTETVTKPDGRLAVKDVTSTTTNNLYVFITATLIDPAGNPLNKDLGLPSTLIR